MSNKKRLQKEIQEINNIIEEISSSKSVLHSRISNSILELEESFNQNIIQLKKFKKMKKIRKKIKKENKIILKELKKLKKELKDNIQVKNTSSIINTLKRNIDLMIQVNNGKEI